MNDRERVRLRHMLDAAREALSFIEGRSRQDLMADRLFLLAVVKEIEIIGEAASQISPETRTAAAGIPWPKIVAMRNRLTHAYFEWDLDAVWAVLTNSLPPLITELEKVLGRSPGPD